MNWQLEELTNEQSERHTDLLYIDMYFERWMQRKWETKTEMRSRIDGWILLDRLVATYRGSRSISALEDEQTLAIFKFLRHRFLGLLSPTPLPSYCLETHHENSNSPLKHQLEHPPANPPSRPPITRTQTRPPPSPPPRPTSPTTRTTKIQINLTII